MSDKAHTVSTVSQQRGLIPWKPGQSGNPAGRPRGSRNKLGEDFIAALAADFIEHGPMVIEKVRVEHPMAYLKLIASVIPQDVACEVHDYADLSDEDLEQLILDEAFKIVGDQAPAS